MHHTVKNLIHIKEEIKLNNKSYTVDNNTYYCLKKGYNKTTGFSYSYLVNLDGNKILNDDYYNNWKIEVESEKNKGYYESSTDYIIRDYKKQTLITNYDATYSGVLIDDPLGLPMTTKPVEADYFKNYRIVIRVLHGTPMTHRQRGSGKRHPAVLQFGQGPARPFRPRLQHPGEHLREHGHDRALPVDDQAAGRLPETGGGQSAGADLHARSVLRPGAERRPRRQRVGAPDHLRQVPLPDAEPLPELHDHSVGRAHRRPGVRFGS